MKYRMVIKDPIDNVIQIYAGEVSKTGTYLLDFRMNSMIGGLVIGSISIEWDSTDGDK